MPDHVYCRKTSIDSWFVHRSASRPIATIASVVNICVCSLDEGKEQHVDHTPDFTTSARFDIKERANTKREQVEAITSFWVYSYSP